jgi:hypothetical protein
MGGASKVDPGETGSQPARQERPLEGRASEGRKTSNGWIQIGHHTQDRELLCRVGLEGPGQLRLAIGEGRRRERDGTFGSYFREAPHGVMQTHAQPPRPRELKHILPAIGVKEERERGLAAGLTRRSQRG